MSIPSRIHPTRAIRSRPANEHFKARYRTILWGSILAAAAAHVIILWLSPTLSGLPEWLSTVDRLALVPPVEARPAPEPPPYLAPPDPGAFGDVDYEPIPRPAAPSIEEIAEPPADAVLAELTQGPRFTPYDVAPELENRVALVDALYEAYPYGAPGIPDRLRAVLWFFIDQYGTVRQIVVRESSGHPDLDAIIVETAAMADFTAAWSVDRNVPAWISLPILFQMAPPEVTAADTTDVVPGR